MTARVIDLVERRGAGVPSETDSDTPVAAIREFLNSAVYIGISESQASLMVPLDALERLTAATLPEAGEVQ